MFRRVSHTYSDLPGSIGDGYQTRAESTIHGLPNKGAARAILYFLVWCGEIFAPVRYNLRTRYTYGEGGQAVASGTEGHQFIRLYFFAYVFF